MGSSQTKDNVVSLANKLREAREAYYNGTPIVEDSVFDAWQDELRGLDPKHPEVVAVGATPVSSWEKVKHSTLMGSLDKVQTPEELVAWATKYGPVDNTLFVSEKFDGISVSLRYQKGMLVQALTRGDGQVGEDITSNVKRMKGVVPKLPHSDSVTFRGEIVLLKADHQAHFPGTSNPRNTASGTSKRFDGKGCEHLSVFVYQVSDGPDFQTEVAQFTYIQKMGFLTAPSNPPVAFTTVVDLWRAYQNGVRDNTPYDIDGLVVRFNDLTFQLGLGDKDGRPLGAVAFKFPSETKETVLREVIWQVGGTGRVTPVAVFDEVVLGGAKVTQASLYNLSYIEKHQLHKNCKILVARAGDVIPRVVGRLP